MWIKFWVLKIHLTNGERCKKAETESRRGIDLSGRGYGF